MLDGLAAACNIGPCGHGNRIYCQLDEPLARLNLGHSSCGILINGVAVGIFDWDVEPCLAPHTHLRSYSWPPTASGNWLRLGNKTRRLDPSLQEAQRYGGPRQPCKGTEPALTLLVLASWSWKMFIYKPKAYLRAK